METYAVGSRDLELPSAVVTFAVGSYLLFIFLDRAAQ